MDKESPTSKTKKGWKKGDPYYVIYVHIKKHTLVCKNKKNLYIDPNLYNPVDGYDTNCRTHWQLDKEVSPI